MKAIVTAMILAALATHSACAQKRLVLVDQDGSGPGGSNQMAMMVFLQSPNVQVLGITMVTGNAWRDEEVQHTLRMLEIIGRTDVPVVPGAVFPLVRTELETRLATALYGKVAWLGAWGQGPTTLVETSQGAMPTTVANPSIPKSNPNHPYFVPPMPEGAPHTKPLDEDAAHFLIRQVHAHPHQVTIFAGGPLTNIALAISIDPQFAALTQGLIVMGGSLDPQTNDPEFSTSPRHEFNFWFDPEAAHIALPGRASMSPPSIFPSRRSLPRRCSMRSRSRPIPPRNTSPNIRRTAITYGTSSPPAPGLTPPSSPGNASFTWTSTSATALPMATPLPGPKNSDRRLMCS